MIEKYPRKDPYAQREAETYSDPIASREAIMQYLADVGRPVDKQVIAEAFAIESEVQQEALRRRLIAMVRDGQLLQNRRRCFALVSDMDLLRGEIISHRDGFGFVHPQDGTDDIFLSPRQMQLVMHGDEVLIRVAGEDYRGRREGHIVEVIARAHKQVVGRYIEQGGVGMVMPESRLVHKTVLVLPQPDAPVAEPGDYVLVEITDYPGRKKPPSGHLVSVLGKADQPGMQSQVVLHCHQIPSEWRQATLSEVSELPLAVTASDYPERRDLRAVPLVTIDGADARDFDDAVYCEPIDGGGWRLLVAIADVSHYVRPGMALDADALDRGNSVYFPDQVIPMLPEVLSNQLCSLRPKVDRLCMVCDMQVDAQGCLKGYDFYEGIMHSHARFTYDQVAKLLDAGSVAETPLLPQLQNLYQLYQALKQQRLLRGAIEFDTVETQILFAGDGKIKKIVPRVRNDAHKLIEECMLLANMATAQCLQAANVPALYRVHHGPDAKRLENVQLFLKALGLAMGGDKQPTPKDYAQLLAQIEGRKDAEIIQTVLLRSMTQAIYQPGIAGHFGLSFDAYCHFTSPIRRYPDLLVHRAIKQVLSGESVAPDAITALERIGQHCSTTERRADAAVRDLEAWLKCEFMQAKVGEVFAGVVSGVTGFGVFVLLSDIYVEGLVHISSLTSDYYQYSDVHHKLTGRRSGRVYTLGDQLTVRVIRVDVEEKQIDFELVEEESAENEGPQPKRGKRRR